MIFDKLKKGDIIVTQLYEGTKAEVVSVEGVLGALLLMMHNSECFLKDHLERYARYDDIIEPYARLFRIADKETHAKLVAEIHRANTDGDTINFGAL